MISTLALMPLDRPGQRFTSGASKSQRRFLDFLVNRVSLWERLGKSHDMVSVLCRDFVESETSKAVDRLLLKSEADLPNDRRSLFVCSECGELGCGAITVAVTRAVDTVIWSDFGYENNYEARVSLDEYKDLGPFEFEFHRYETALLGAVGQLKSAM
jgi:hypothetical protein